MVESTTEPKEQRAPEFITQAAIAETPKSNWYRYTLHCRHHVYTRVRISFRVSFQQHYIRCPECQIEKDKEPGHASAWQAMEQVEAVSDEHVSNVLSGLAFILPNRILRTDGDSGPSGNPFPYTSSDRDY